MIANKNRNTLEPMNIYVFKRYISDRTKDIDINRSFKKFNNFVLSEEKDYAILNNAFSEYGSKYMNKSQSKRIKSRRNTKRMSLNFSLYKIKNSITSDILNNNYLKNMKVKNKPINLKTSSTKNDKKSNITINIFNKTLNNKLPKMKEIKKELLIFKNNVNTISSKIINPNKKNIKINNCIIRRNDISEEDKFKINLSLNKTDGLFNTFKKSKKRINFVEFYNINSNKKEVEKESNMINTISYKTMNNIYQKNSNKNMLYYDIKRIKDINYNCKNKIEKIETKLNIKSKKFNKKYKQHEIKFFGNQELKLLKNNQYKNKKKKIIRSHKEIYIPRKIFGNNNNKERTISEEIQLRKQKEKQFYDKIDNIMLNNDLFVYDINKIDKRLRLKNKEIKKS